ncbi:hypothetical protein [Marinobacter sp. C2H3]
MPFINERLEANRESIEQNRAASGPVFVCGVAIRGEVVGPYVE